MELEIHPRQIDILLVLLFKPRARFRDLNTSKMETDHFNFHVRRLLLLDLITKSQDGYYQLTSKGKEFSNRFDTDSVVLERQSKISILVCCVKTERRKKLFLFQKRLKEPYFGYVGWVTGKVRWGETIINAAARELEEETHLRANLDLAGIMHSLIYSFEDKLLEDKVFFIYRAENIKGELLKKFDGGENIWMPENIASRQPNVFYDFKEIMEIVTSKKESFVENKFKVSYF